MNLPTGAFYNVSGIDPNEGAKTVFVWRRDKGTDDYALLGSGHVVGVLGRPPGIQQGQFSITFPLPPGCSAEDLVVTDDTSGKEPLPNVIRRPCSVVAEFKFGGRVSSGDRAVTLTPQCLPQIKPSQAIQ